MTLEELKEGDLALIQSSGYVRIATIDRVTKTQIIADRIKFNRKSGRSIGSGHSYFRRYLSVASPERVAEIRAGEKRASMIARIEGACSRLSLRQMTDEKLQEIYQVLFETTE